MLPIEKCAVEFQLTTSRRGRRKDRSHNSSHRNISTHDLTKRSTLIQSYPKWRGIFQLTTSRRGRLVVEITERRRGYFNSRPHEEVDVMVYSFPGNRDISTHDLTKRSTAFSQHFSMLNPFQLTTSRRGRHDFVPTFRMAKEISTHDLTKRSTKHFREGHHVKVFQLTTSRRGRR